MKKCPKGKLYIKYFNQLRRLRNHGLMTPKSNALKNSDIEMFSRTSENLDAEISMYIYFIIIILLNLIEII